MPERYTISAPTPCRRCRYDLVGLDARGRCPECGDPIGRSVRLCPRCGPPLSKSTSPGAFARRCPECAGLGFEKGALRAAVRKDQLAPAAAGPSEPVVHTIGQVPLLCRRCNAAMETIGIEHRGVVIDRCPTCGWIWIDAGELPHVLAYAARSLHGRPPPPDLEQLLADPVALSKRVLEPAGLAGGETWLMAEAILWVLAALGGLG